MKAEFITLTKRNYKLGKEKLGINEFSGFKSDIHQ